MKLFEAKDKKSQNKVCFEPEVKRISIKNIKFAPYQRELNQTKVRKIVKEFMPDIVDYPLISLRRGEFWCVDGQHIIKALEEMGYTEVVCRVISGLTYEEECLRFVILNTSRTRLTANQIFHGRVEEKDINAIALVNAFAKYGYKYNKNCSGRGENLIGTVSSFVYIQNNYGMSMVERVLNILRKAWFGEEDSVLASIVNGLKTFLHEYENCDDAILIKALDKITPRALDEEARATRDGRKARRVRADSTCYHVAKIIEELYEDEKALSGRRKKVKTNVGD